MARPPIAEHDRKLPTTVNFSAELLADLRKLAEEEERPLSAMVRHLVSAGLKSEYDIEVEESE